MNVCVLNICIIVYSVPKTIFHNTKLFVLKARYVIYPRRESMELN